MATKCHVCGQPVRKAISIPVCGEPSVQLTVCSARCRDEYLGGYVETQDGKVVRMLHRPRGAGLVLAALWGVYGLVLLVGGPLGRIVPIPLLPSQPGPEFYSGGVAALLVAYAVGRGVRLARWFSIGLAVMGVIFAALTFIRSRQLTSLVAAVTVFPAVILLSVGDPGPRRAIGAVALFSIWPAALLVTAIMAASIRGQWEEQVAAESYPGLVYDDTRNGLRFSVPSGWYILREDSRLLPHHGALFRTLHPAGGLVATVHDRPDCDPTQAIHVERLVRGRVLPGLAADGSQVDLVGDPLPRPVESALGRGHGVFVGRIHPDPALWYLVFLPWTRGRCLELRCGGSTSAERLIRGDCIQLGARALSPLATPVPSPGTTQ